MAAWNLGRPGIVSLCLLCMTAETLAADTRGSSTQRPEAQGTGHAREAGEDGLQTENMFGFTLGSDTDEAGAKALALENAARFGKRIGSYRALGQKLEFGYGVTDDLNVALAFLGDYHRVRGVPELDDVRGRYGFAGIGGEVRWRLLRRETAPVGLTVHIEPSISRFDETSGQTGRKLGSENRLIIDRELVPGTLFSAVNLIYDLERFREYRSGEVERGSNAGAAAALSFQIAPKVLVGGEVRYLRAYDGLALNRYTGDALLIGPTFFARLPHNTWVSASWNVQVTGRERIDRAGLVAAVSAGDFETAAGIARPRRLNLGQFQRHALRLKLGIEF